jgi:hypothetical protein
VPRSSLPRHANASSPCTELDVYSIYSSINLVHPPPHNLAMSWWDTITSTPALLAASAVTLSAALFVRGRADPSVISEQAKEVDSAAGADTSRAKMAQAVSLRRRRSRRRSG